jgi:flagellin-like protein
MKANKFAKNDEGVSAVIGVILMVAITVILAAVIAAFVFGMVGGVKKTYNIAVTTQRINATTVIVTYNGGPDNTHCTALAVTATKGTGTQPYTLAPTVGSTLQITDTIQDSITVTSSWDDGSSSVVMQETL